MIRSVIDNDVRAAIDWLLENDRDVTARAVASRVGVAPSTITRSANRMEAVASASTEQSRLRRIAANKKSSREALVAMVDRRDKTIAELQRKVIILTASHRAMLMAVGEIGGVAAWKRFFVKHEEIRQDLLAMRAIPELPGESTQRPEK